MKKILVVDDSLLMRNIIKERLSEKFSVVGEAKNGEDAIRLSTELKPDIITMDITMDGMNGMEAAKTILASHQNIAIVMISALNENKLLSDAIKIGIKDFLVKPFTPQQLISAIEKVAEKLK